MEPSREQPERSDDQTPLPRSRPDSFVGPIQRRPPLSRSSAPQPMARRPYQAEPAPSTPAQAPEPIIAPEPVMTPESTPVMQMPQPESLAPPEQSQAVPQPSPPAEQAAPVQPVERPSQPQPLGQKMDFTPPPRKNRRRWMYPALAVVVTLVLGAGIFSYAKALAARNNPDTVMRDAISNTLSLKTLQSTTKYADTNITTKYDFTDAKNPVISAASSVTTPKGQAMINGYGDLKNTYFNYESLPKGVAANIAKQMSNTWVQVRQNGEMPKNVPDIVFKASDPRFQAFGPIIMGNFDGQTKEQLLDFMLKNKVYGYEVDKVKKEKIGDETVFVFPIKLDVSFLQVASQSAALNVGLEPADTQLAIEAMESLRDASVTLYVNAGDHTFSRMYISKDGAAKTIDLSGYKETRLPAAPQTKLVWQGFIPLQNQIEAQSNLTKAPY